MDSGKMFRTLGTIVLTGVIQAIVFCLFVGLPLPQFTTSRDLEALQFQKMPEQKQIEPLQPLESQTVPAPEPVAPVAQQPAKRKPYHPKRHPVTVAKTKVKKVEKAAEEPDENTAEQKPPTKVLVVNFDKPSDEKPSENKPSDQESKAEVKPQQEQTQVQTPDADPKPALTAEEIERQEAREVQPTPVSDKLAGVAPDDSETEATPDVNQNPTDQDSSAVMDSMEKSDSLSK